MNLQKILYVILISFLIVLPLSAGELQMKTLFPEKMADQGWKAEEEPFIAIDEESLSMVINGAAPQYYELGTKKAGFANYEKGDVYLMLEIYETDSLKSAEKLFEEFKTDNTKSLDNLGTQSRFKSEMGGSYMAEFFQDRFYVRLSITKKSEETKKSIINCAKTISDKISQYKKQKS
jgi:hypothetical protein